METKKAIMNPMYYIITFIVTNTSNYTIGSTIQAYNKYIAEFPLGFESVNNET